MKWTDDVTHDQFDAFSDVKQQDQSQESFFLISQFMFHEDNSQCRDSSSALSPLGTSTTQQTRIIHNAKYAMA